jgi:hypothetical protein
MIKWILYMSIVTTSGETVDYEQGTFSSLSQCKTYATTLEGELPVYDFRCVKMTDEGITVTIESKVKDD